MTIIKNLSFPTQWIIAQKEDPYAGDTEIVESMSGVTFRNGRRSVARRTFTLTLRGPVSHANIASIIALKATVQGRLFGFHFTPIGESTPLDVCFTEDDWGYEPPEAPAVYADRYVEFEVGLEQVIDGVAE